ncbi:MAG: 3'(2'),5'-bisphosphate nucleotidase CysQ [Candidatus Marinimicrobia bacterium]|nr:3'(2'),5'-bisphosphate nucleotidase CysQ [Candidatus Neomarinimicrobiota bacterium]
MQNLLADAVDAAREAGKILRGYYKADYQIRDKGFRNPVTTADYASNHYLEERLRSSYPEYGWLSEETVDSSDRLQRERLWVVDPLDGTKEFIEGVPNFVVSIALVEAGQPVLGVLHNPVTNETFSAAKGMGAHLDGDAITVSSLTNLAEAEILNSRSETRRGLWKPYKHHFRALKPVGSVAYKLGLVAAGRGDMFATLRPKSEWDICAGHCILREAGADLKVVTGKDLTYNQKKVVIKPGLVAGNAAIMAKFIKLYNYNHR